MDESGGGIVRPDVAPPPCGAIPTPGIPGIPPGIPPGTPPGIIPPDAPPGLGDPHLKHVDFEACMLCRKEERTWRVS
jgi:hypothetical protein